MQSPSPSARERLFLYVRSVRQTFEGRNIMEISARNQLPATVKLIKLGTVMAEVVMAVGGYDVVAAITRSSVERMELKAGDQVTAVIKATEVMVAK